MIAPHPTSVSRWFCSACPRCLPGSLASRPGLRAVAATEPGRRAGRTRDASVDARRVLAPPTPLTPRRRGSAALHQARLPIRQRLSAARAELRARRRLSAAVQTLVGSRRRGRADRLRRRRYRAGRQRRGQIRLRRHRHLVLPAGRARLHGRRSRHRPRSDRTRPSTDGHALRCRCLQPETPASAPARSAPCCDGRDAAREPARSRTEPAPPRSWSAPRRTGRWPSA